MPRQYTPRVHLICAQCGRDFDVAAGRGDKAKFCSRECFGASCVVVHEGDKRCSRCGETKPVAEFHRHLSRHSGAATSYCRPCTSLQKEQWRRANLDRAAEHSLGWKCRNPDRARIVLRAIATVQRALKRGDLIRPSACTECGASGRSITAAHADYTRPLDVRWLCRACHTRWDHAEPKTLTASSPNTAC